MFRVARRTSGSSGSAPGRAVSNRIVRAGKAARRVGRSSGHSPRVGMNPEDHGMTTIEKLRTLARKRAGEAKDYDRRRLRAQAHIRRLAATAV